MSGFGAVFHLDGRPPDERALAGMQERLQRRGPEGGGIRIVRETGLASAQLHNTLESHYETLPFICNQSGLGIVGDVRIDNRSELIDALRLHGAETQQLADSRLVLTAYQKWGEACLQHLVGDFAFAIWDEKRETLFCARDHFGMKPFFYFHRPGVLFACASEPNALFALPEVPRTLNEQRVWDFLTQSFEDKEVTFYEGIRRLPQAHSIEVRRSGIKKRRYWQADINNEIRLGSDAEYTEGFRALFDEAVRCRLRSSYPVGATLSGGLDSSSVAATAARLTEVQGKPLVHTFSAIFPTRVAVDPRIDERQYMRAVAESSHVQAHEIRADLRNPLVPAYWQGAEAMPGMNMYMDQAFVETAHQHGVRTILTGHDGDSVVSHGFERLPQLAKRGNWLRLFREIDAVAGRFSTRRRRIFRRQLLQPLLAEAASLRWLQRGEGQNGMQAAAGLLNAGFAAQIACDRCTTVGYAPEPAAQNLRHEHWLALDSGLYSYAAELLDSLAARQQIEFRHPFFDKRLVEFSIALPLDQKLRNGWPRAILREAMRDTLPPAVRCRLTKANLGINFRLGLWEHERERLHDFVQNQETPAAKYLNFSYLRNAYSLCSKKPEREGEEIFALSFAVILSQWLQQNF